MAFLNWRLSSNDNINNMLNMADGFMLSALELAKLCLQSNEGKRADILIFPILTNANHGIELYLKAILWTLNTLAGSELKIEGGHNIKQIYTTITAKVKKYGGNVDFRDFQRETADLADYLQELFAKIKATEKDNKMDFSRYPISGKYDNHFYVDEIGNVEVDLVNFVNRFSSIQQSLEHLSDVLYHQDLHRE